MASLRIPRAAFILISLVLTVAVAAALSGASRSPAPAVAASSPTPAVTLPPKFGEWLIAIEDARVNAALVYITESLQAVARLIAWSQIDVIVAFLYSLDPFHGYPVDVGLWERLHVCEQGDTWYANGTNPGGGGQVFQGGLGMSTGAWQLAVSAAAALGITLPGSALAASIEEQMLGAQIFADTQGWGWSCHV